MNLDTTLLFFLASVLLVFALICALYHKLKPYPVDPSLPGPTRTPFFGILPFVRDNFERWPTVVYKYSERYQNRTWGGPVPYLGSMRGAYFIITDDRNIEYILAENFENYEKGDLFRTAFGELLGNGIFAADGKDWYHHRKLASRMFSKNLLRESSAVTLKKVQELSKVLGANCTEVDIQTLFFHLTFDTTFEVAFGVDYRDDSNAKNTAQQMELAFDELQGLLLERLRDPLFQLKRKLQLTQRERRIRELKKMLDDHAIRVIRSRRRTAAKSELLGPDILSRYVDFATNNKVDITDEELRDVVMNILVAGRDTTAAALSWAIYELTRNPDVITKLRQEADSICGNDDYSYDTIAKLEYAHAVVYEVLRLHPSVPSDAKYAIEDDVLPDGTFIPKQTMVGYPPYAMGRSTRIWGPDAECFQPERWLINETKNISAFRFPVFNAGKRLCLGKPMAMNTMKLTLAYLVQRHDFQDVQQHSGEYSRTLVNKMKGGFPVNVRGKEEGVKQ